MSAAARGVFLGVAVALAAGAVGCGGGEEPTPVPEADGPVRSALFRFGSFSGVRTVDGEQVRLSALEGRVAVLVYFGTWSEPCRRAAPLLVSLFERFRGAGLQILGLAYELTENPEQARRSVCAFRDEFKIPFPLALGPETAWRELEAQAAVSRRLPTLVLVDRQGVAREVFEGLPKGYEGVLADRVERLLAEPYVPLAPKAGGPSDQTGPAPPAPAGSGRR